MTNKTLYIHAGGPKTGSSALQNFLARNKSQLNSLDFAYENSPVVTKDFQITGGNGMWLYDGLASLKTTANQIDNMVLHYFGKCNNAICSSEYFSVPDGANWDNLFNSMLRLNVRLKVIFYVRNAAPLLQSNYDQAIKRHGETAAFSEWIIMQKWQHAGSLKRLACKIPISDLIVLSYDNNRTNLIRSFLNAIALDEKFEFVSDDHTQQINRSLTAEEREIFVMVNKKLGGFLSDELSELLIYANPEISTEPPSVSEEMEMSLLERFTHEADWINKTFFNGQPVISVLPTKSKTITEPNIKNRNGAPRCDVQQVVLSWAIEKLGTIEAEVVELIINALSGAAIKQSEKYQMGIPIDFDPIAYLTLNPDLIKAGVDPFQHFVQFGKSEMRPYKYIKENATASPEQEIQELYCHIEILNQLLKQSLIVFKATLHQAHMRERELSSNLALELTRSGLHPVPKTPRLV